MTYYLSYTILFVLYEAKILSRFCPGKCQKGSMTGKNWNRDIEKDLEQLKNTYNCKVILTLMEQVEITRVSPKLFDKAKEYGIETIHLPIVDGDIPNSMEDTISMLKKLSERVEKGETVVIHCLGGIGRTGMIAACLFKCLNPNYSFPKITEMVKKTRQGTLRSRHQLGFFEQFSESLSTEKN